MSTTPKKTTCNRGHTFMKSTATPVCPKCWPGYYEKKDAGELSHISRPAQRALAAKGIVTVAELSQLEEKTIAELHGIGPTVMKKLKAALKSKGLSFRNKQ